MKKQTVSADATIYNYTLLHKIGSRHPVFIWSTSLIGLIGLWDLLALGWRGLAMFLGVWAGLQVFYTLVIRLVLRVTASNSTLQWRWSLAKPWPGYLPCQFVPVGLIKRLYRHLLVLGILLSALLYVWVTPLFLLNLLLLHVFTIAPVFAYSRKFYLLRPDSVLRFNAKDISCYKV